MQMVIDAHGQVRCLYTEALDLAAIGSLTIRRASQVEPDASGQWWANLSAVNGPCLGPYCHRSQALAGEQAWLESNVLLHTPTAT
jgi:hypothetical protein